MRENKFKAFNGVFKGIATTRDEEQAVVAFSTPPRFIVINVSDNVIIARVELTSNATSLFVVDEPGCERFIVLALEDKTIQIFSMSQRFPQLLYSQKTHRD